jgi:hypothetical protein
LPRLQPLRDLGVFERQTQDAPRKRGAYGSEPDLGTQVQWRQGRRSGALATLSMPAGRMASITRP